jgi:hypothetical protein
LAAEIPLAKRLFELAKIWILPRGISALSNSKYFTITFFTTDINQLFFKQPSYGVLDSASVVTLKPIFKKLERTLHMFFYHVIN